MRIVVAIARRRGCIARRVAVLVEVTWIMVSIWAVAASDPDACQHH
jgi:hypothetical protein